MSHPSQVITVVRPGSDAAETHWELAVILPGQARPDLAMTVSAAETVHFHCSHVAFPVELNIQHIDHSSIVLFNANMPSTMPPTPQMVCLDVLYCVVRPANQTSTRIPITSLGIECECNVMEFPHHPVGFLWAFCLNTSVSDSWWCNSFVWIGGAKGQTTFCCHRCCDNPLVCHDPPPSWATPRAGFALKCHG